MHDESDNHANPNLTTIFATSEADLIPVIKSVLRGAEIEYMTDGEDLMNLFPSDLLGPTLHRPRGEVRFRVAESDVEAARAVLSEYSGNLEEIEASAEAHADEASEG